MKHWDADLMWGRLLLLGVSDQTIRVVCAINGYTRETMEDILYATSGYRDFDQLEGQS